jgi:hypothetical protein
METAMTSNDRAIIMQKVEAIEDEFLCNIARLILIDFDNKTKQEVYRIVKTVEDAKLVIKSHERVAY